MEEILRPTSSYIQSSDEAFRDVLHKALDEELHVEEESLDYTRKLTQEEIEELTIQAEAFESGESVVL
ncbi:cell division protein DivIVA, partial [Streptococcus suis]